MIKGAYTRSYTWIGVRGSCFSRLPLGDPRIGVPSRGNGYEMCREARDQGAETSYDTESPRI
jgi:hypothetical protein